MQIVGRVAWCFSQPGPRFLIVDKLSGLRYNREVNGLNG